MTNRRETLLSSTKATLAVAHRMLMAVENGQSFSHREWDDALAQIEMSLQIDSPRARCLMANVIAGQALRATD